MTVSDGCDLGENLATRAMTNLAERGSLGENRILNDQQKVKGTVDQELLARNDIWPPSESICRPVGEDACPTHNGLFAPIPCGGDRPKIYPNASGTAMLAVDN
jgi:hypothetical protein